MVTRSPNGIAGVVSLELEDLIPATKPVLKIGAVLYEGYVYGKRIPGVPQAMAEEAWNGGFSRTRTEKIPDPADESGERKLVVPARHDAVERRRACENVAVALVDGLTPMAAAMIPYPQLLEVLYELEFLIRPEDAEAENPPTGSSTTDQEPVEEPAAPERKTVRRRST